jgi:hypothetical protein
VALHALLWGGLGLWLLQTLRHWREVDITQAGILLLGVGVSLRYARGIPDAALMTFPLLTATGSTLLARHTPVTPRRAQGEAP